MYTGTGAGLIAVALPVVSFSFFIQSSALQIIPSGPIADKAETLDYPAIPFAYALPLNSNVADSKTQKLRNPGYKGAVLGKV